MDENDELKFLKSLSKQYPTIAAASTEIINLQSILNLPNQLNIFLLIFTESMSSLIMFLRMDQVQ